MPADTGGWQQRATKKLEEQFKDEVVWPTLNDSSRALFMSQHGPLASAPFTALPTSKATKVDAQLDMFGHHRAACAVAGVLGRRGFPLECAAAQICREAGAQVITNVHMRDMIWTSRSWRPMERRDGHLPVSFGQS